MGAAGNGPFLLVLFIGAVIVLVDGQLIFRNGPAYLSRVYRVAEHARQVSNLVAVLFHLLMLGLVALVASVGWSGAPGPGALIARVGVLLLLTALGHAATIAVLSRLREQQIVTDLAESQVHATRGDELAASDLAEQRFAGGPAGPADEAAEPRYAAPEPPLDRAATPARVAEPGGGEISGLPPEDPDSDPLTRTPRAGWRRRPGPRRVR
jgi:hypothetical protein